MNTREMAIQTIHQLNLGGFFFNTGNETNEMKNQYLIDDLDHYSELFDDADVVYMMAYDPFKAQEIIKQDDFLSYVLEDVVLEFIKAYQSVNLAEA